MSYGAPPDPSCFPWVVAAFAWCRGYLVLLLVLVRLFVLLVVYCYAAIAPLLLPVACLIYLGSFLVYKNQALYVYVQTADGGGSVSVYFVIFAVVVVMMVVFFFFPFFLLLDLARACRRAEMLRG